MDLPEVYFGEVSDQEINWRTETDDEKDADENIPASDELIAVLGFNPDKENI